MAELTEPQFTPLEFKRFLEAIDRNLPIDAPGSLDT